MEKTISWTLTLPGDQTVLKYYASYRASNEQTENLPVSNEARSITVDDVEYNTNYLFEIQVETQGGKSKRASTWLSVSGTPIYNVDIQYCVKIIGMHAGINLCLTLAREIDF